MPLSGWRRELLLQHLMSVPTESRWHSTLVDIRICRCKFSRKMFSRISYTSSYIDNSFTTQDWSGARVFLSSMTALDLGSHDWKNITTYSETGDSGSRNSTPSNIPPILRADSTLTYVPNLGTDNKGVLVAIGVGFFVSKLGNYRPS